MRTNQTTTNTETVGSDLFTILEDFAFAWGEIAVGCLVFLVCADLWMRSKQRCLAGTRHHRSPQQDHQNTTTGESNNRPQALSYSNVINLLPMNPRHCPIGTTLNSIIPSVQNTITTPVVAQDGITYDKDNYVAWIEHQRNAGKPYSFSPLSDQKLDSSLSLEYLTQHLRHNLDFQFWNTIGFEPNRAPCCPISISTMIDPVIDSHGHSFEQTEINRWLSDPSNNCPINREPCHISDLIPNHTLKKAIQQKEEVYSHLNHNTIAQKTTSTTQYQTLSSQEKKQPQHTAGCSLNFLSIPHLFSIFNTAPPSPTPRPYSATDHLLEQHP